MTKKIFIVAIVVMCLSLCFVACNDTNDTVDDSNSPQLAKFTGITFSNLTVGYDGEEHELLAEGIPAGANVSYTNNVATEDGIYNATATITKEGYETLTLNAKLEIVMTAEYIVNARAVSAEKNEQNYDFFVNLAGTLEVGGFSGTANANYDCDYRFNSYTNELKFKRVTSGALLYDSTEYIYNTGSSKIKVITDEDGDVLRTSVVPEEEEELNLINIPFVALVDHIDPNNLTNIERLSGGKYDYKATLALASDNANVQNIIDFVGKLGTNIEMGDVSLTNPANGIDFYFSFSNDKTELDDFKFCVDISFPIKGVQTTLELTYEQTANDTEITIPSTSSIITDDTTICDNVDSINSALLNLKNSDAYSLDLEAVNEFDPGWNTSAIVDKYFARMYKNTNDGRVDFNHSFEYKAHSEEDGAETYKYTYGNIQDGTVHLVSRKGSNVITATPSITANSQFDYLTGLATINASDVDCMRIKENNGTVTYTIYLKKTATLGVQDKIVDIINSNDAEGVVDVDNHFNSDEYIIKEAKVEVVMTDGKIVSVTVETELKYNPTSGEFTEEQITLSNTIVLKVDENLDAALEYVAPKGTTTTLGSLGLNNVTFYIR